MTQYRLYFLSGPDNHIVRFEAIDAGTDAEAEQLAEAFAGSRPMELWDQGRKVRSWDGASTTSPQAAA
jgi:hypothetical protein